MKNRYIITEEVLIKLLRDADHLSQLKQIGVSKLKKSHLNYASLMAMSEYDLREQAEVVARRTNSHVRHFVHTKGWVERERLKNEAGIVYERNDGRGYQVAYQQAGAEQTFAVGMPVYDSYNHKLGYLGLGLYENLNCSSSDSFHEAIPMSMWSIEQPT